MPRTADFKEKGSSVSTARATRLVLTNRHLRGLKPTAHAQDFYDVQQRGLIARILPSAIVPFSVRYRFPGETETAEARCVSRRLTSGRANAHAIRRPRSTTGTTGWRTTCGESRANGHHRSTRRRLSEESTHVDTNDRPTRTNGFWTQTSCPTGEKSRCAI